jgi:hypothetical protein
VCVFRLGMALLVGSVPHGMAPPVGTLPIGVITTLRLGPRGTIWASPCPDQPPLPHPVRRRLLRDGDEVIVLQDPVPQVPRLGLYTPYVAICVFLLLVVTVWFARSRVSV